MEKTIAGYTKTDHFLLRQWQRKVPDDLLFKVLNALNEENGNFLLIVSRSFIKKSSKQKTTELFVKIKGKVLVTCFYGNLNEIMKPTNNDNYKLIQ